MARVEWPTLLLMIACYGLWGMSLWAGPIGILGIAATSAFHSSLQHEVIHGHPFRGAQGPLQWINEALVAPALGLLVPYHRFRDTHLAHHRDACLTDPYDDPESNFLDPVTWGRLPASRRRVLVWNNTLLGRILLGPLIGLGTFLWSDLAAARAGDRQVTRAWLLHLPALSLVLALVLWSPMPLWAYSVGAYLGHGLLKIRTFAEHRAHQHCAARSVVIEDRGPLALLFLNNNLHAVHHMHPSVAWYDLPGLYRRNKARYLDRNDGYVFASYGALFARYLVQAKDPVPHPLRGPK